MFESKYATSLLPDDLSDYCSLPLSRLETLNNTDSYAFIQRRSSENVWLTSALALFDEILPTVGYDDRDRSNAKERHYLAQDLHRNKRNIMSTNPSRIGYCTVSNFWKQYNKLLSQAVYALGLRCIADVEFSRWRRRSRNFPGYMLYISIDIVLFWESYPQLHKLILI